MGQRTLEAVAAALLCSRYEANTGAKLEPTPDDIRDAVPPEHWTAALRDAEAAIQAYEASRPPVHDDATCRVCAEPKA